MNLLITDGPPEQREQIIDRLLDEIDEPVGGIRRVSITPTKHEIEDMETKTRADVTDGNTERRPTVEQKHIDVETLSETTEHAIDDAIRKGHVILIDTISKVEMHSSAFREAVRDAFRGGEDVIAFVDKGYVDMYREEGTVISMKGKETDDTVHTILTKLGV